MGILRASFRAGKPPTSSKRLRSPKTSNWVEQRSGVMLLLEGRPSHVGPGISIFWPFWMKYCERLFSSKRVTTLDEEESKKVRKKKRPFLLVGRSKVTYVNFELVSRVLPLP